ncbi:MAG: Ig-like domain-containing protein [Clostridia bacterium]|nr:Ig-like domain-containing protein [Clostridia bacterium]
MSIKRIMSIAVVLLMVLALVPASALAEGVSERLKLAELDRVWKDLEAVEDDMLARKAGMSEVVMAVYNAAVNDSRVDKGSFTDISAHGFFFRIDGMCCAYDYRVRNTEHVSAVTPKLAQTVTRAVEQVNAARDNAGSMDVLLVGPQYKEDLTVSGYYDSSFTMQYMNEIRSIGAATGGQVTILGGHNATGPAIAAAYPGKGVVIYDSHGIAGNGTSYLCLTTNSGVTSTDYSNGWAVNSGSEAYIDGRYVQNHVTSPLSGCFVWMAICEGMKSSGRGTTGTALLAAGAACVYGYSQSVTFAGDYLYEEVFWNEMKNGATVKDALSYMKYVHGVPDPYGDAWPILMSAVDPFPSTPDGEQTVNSEWRLFPDVDITGWNLESSYDIYNGFTDTIELQTIPENANNYTLDWSVADSSIATIQPFYNKVLVTGRQVGSTNVTAAVKKAGQTVGTVTCRVNVLSVPSLNEAANVEGGTLNFTSTTSNYPWRVGVVNGEPVAMSGNQHVGNSTSTLQLVLEMQAGEELRFKWLCSSEEDYDYYYFYVNGTQKAALDGETDWIDRTFTATTAGTYTFQWRFVKDPYSDGVTDAGYLKDVAYIRSYIPGDVNLNGEVSAEDALIALRYTMDMQAIEPTGLLAGDVNGDGTVNAEDALLILRMSMGL